MIDCKVHTYDRLSTDVWVCSRLYSVQHAYLWIITLPVSFLVFLYIVVKASPLYAKESRLVDAEGGAFNFVSSLRTDPTQLADVLAQCMRSPRVPKSAREAVMGQGFSKIFATSVNVR